MNDYSEQLAEGAVLITVNQRLARHHLARYQRWQLAQGHRWWETPAILPLRAWLRALHADALSRGLSRSSLLPELLQQKLWRQCIEMDAGLTLLDVEAATSAARSSWELACVWQCHPSDEDYLSLDQYSWQRWCSRYQQFQEQASRVDEASLPAHLIDVLTDPAASTLLPRQVILDGFIALPPLLTEFFGMLETLGTNVLQPLRHPDAAVFRHSFGNDDEELLSIAAHMRFELTRDPDQSFGLVVPDLQKRRAAVMRAFDRVFYPSLSPAEIRSRGRPYDLSLGMPLSDSSVVGSALMLLKLCVSSISGSELSAVLLSPYLKAADSEARRREQLDRRLRDERVRSLTLEQLQEKLYSGSRLNRAIHKLLGRRRLGSAPLSEWASRFSDCLSILGWPGESLDSEEYQAASAWYECLDDMQLLDEGERIGASAALQIVRRLSRERIFQLDTPRTPIQIMGRLESHGIDFDCLWIAGLDSEQWPPAGSPDPFLPVARQKQQGVPAASAAARLALAELEFRLWCTQAPLLITSHAESREGKLLEAAAVPVVATSMANAATASERLARLQDLPPPPDPISELQKALTLERVVDDHGPALATGSAVGGGARLFENQALCPFRAFALHRLQIRPLEEAGLGLDPRQHGTLLHRTLEVFWKDVQSHGALLGLSAEERVETIRQAIELALDELQVPSQLHALEKTRLTVLVEEWLTECEMPRQPFEVVFTEQRQSIEHGGIVMNVMLDRIDRVGDALLVLDYKTGTGNKVSTWAEHRIVNPQLPLYVLTDDSIQGVGFAQIARHLCAFKGVAAENELLPRVKTTVNLARSDTAPERSLDNWHDWREHWRTALDEVAAEVRQGLASITPMRTACVHCELKSLCRVDEIALSISGESEDDLDAASGSSLESEPTS